jgi:methylmalonyl-CoA/ethylmalonyl-CoA epimerase
MSENRRHSRHARGGAHDAPEPPADAPIEVHAIDHVAVAVPDLEQAMRLYAGTFGARITAPVEIESQGIRIAYAEFTNARIELMQPIRPDSPVARFLERNPKGGIHHFCLTTDDADRAAANAAAGGPRLAGAPVRGHHGRKLFFLHPDGMMGALVEVEQAE